MVFYRKYRPQTIEELDSKSVRDILYSVFSKPIIPHAFLFTGPKGLGKTSTARIVAKVVNCQHLDLSSDGNKSNSEIEPCNKCNQCMSITSGINLDVMEIDGASNGLIDDIRDLLGKINLVPLLAKNKVYIIDEVHMVTTGAFNALLKTLEEPPTNVLFILCTTELHKVPATIISRCFNLQFRVATTEELVHSFTRILEKEKVPFDVSALEDIAQLSEGSFRDGAKVLEECVTLISGQAQKITKEIVEEKHRVISIEKYLEQMIDHLKKKDTIKALDLVEDMIKIGINIKQYLEQLISRLHLSMLQELGIGNKVANGVVFSIEESKILINLLGEAYGAIRHAVILQLPLEMVIIDWCRIDNFKINNESIVITDKSEIKISNIKTNLVKENKSNDAEGKIEVTKIEDKEIWSTFIKNIKQQNRSVAGLLASCYLIETNDYNLVIATGYSFHKEKLCKKESMELMEKIYKDLTGKSVTVLVELRDKK
ncbi:MAG: DNA polymerase III subunit gamma/tau [Candidatus Levybacteria bacterium]|nr:DNA polymerase III subunit gamma/tau [Candidatus Levybacteria bacterium]MSU26014.1 DNA polymerase III subunit gamma/tau [Candidatus Levybacteria bacterium]